MDSQLAHDEATRPAANDFTASSTGPNGQQLQDGVDSQQALQNGTLNIDASKAISGEQDMESHHDQPPLQNGNGTLTDSCSDHPCEDSTLGNIDDQEKDISKSACNGANVTIS